MDQTKKYKIKVNSKKEYRQARYILRALGETVSDRRFDDNKNKPTEMIWKVNGVWRPASNYSTSSWGGQVDLTVADLLEDLVKIIPRPKKSGSVSDLTPEATEQVMSKMATEDKTEPDYPFKECAVRVKNRKQLVEVFKYLGITKLDALYITGSIEANSSYDNICVSLNNQKPSLDTDIAKAGLNLGSQDYFRKLQYYIMEYNNFKKKTGKI